ncbi:hypothetical protein EVAR_7840_1 [Eumeta japonica]|uniref:Uncharacterized protein n=1 Tax=Eumeta variegata TaxID=151549 RepID=A0A4C1TV14_EUMVA|nr:hypothetical protein EVAR_7840_1 [Eumeta japonica]
MQMPSTIHSTCDKRKMFKLLRNAGLLHTFVIITQKSAHQSVEPSLSTRAAVCACSVASPAARRPRPARARPPAPAPHRYSSIDSHRPLLYFRYAALTNARSNYPAMFKRAGTFIESGQSWVRAGIPSDYLLDRIVFGSAARYAVDAISQPRAPAAGPSPRARRARRLLVTPVWRGRAAAVISVTWAAGAARDSPRHTATGAACSVDVPG